MVRVRFQEEIVGPGNGSAIVRRFRVRGSNEAIGQMAAAVAASRHGVRPEDLLGDGRYVRARRAYFQRTYPIHLERMRGVARAFDLRLDDDRFDFSILRCGSRAALRGLAGTACYLPAWAGESGRSLLRRDGPLPNSPGAPLELYLMEWRPIGMPFGSIAVHIDDLLSGAIVGINAAGLGATAVAVAMPPADAAGNPGRRAAVSAVGLHELGLVRLVLDTCRTIDEAQAALLGAHVFPMIAPARYLFADVSGRSFAYEPSLDHCAQTIVDGGGDPQVISSWGSDGMAADHGYRCVVDLEDRSIEVILPSGKGSAAGSAGAREPVPGSAEDEPVATVRLAAAVPGLRRDGGHRGHGAGSV